MKDFQSIPKSQIFTKEQLRAIRGGEDTTYYGGGGSGNPNCAGDTGTGQWYCCTGTGTGTDLGTTTCEEASLHCTTKLTNSLSLCY